jgi:hypothetical protein
MDNVILILQNDNADTCVVDLYGVEKIPMNFAFTNPSELAVVGGGSWNFRIPASETNLSFFGDISNVNFVGEFSFHKKVKATLTVDTIPVSVGHVQVLKAYKIENVYSEFEIVFFAETPDIAREIGSKLLSALDYTALVHDMTYDNVVAGSTNWKYALIDRGYKFSELGEVNTRPIVSTINPVYPSEMSLMIRESWLFDKMIREAGFTYTTDNILNEMEAVYIPFVNSKWNRSTSQPAQFLFSAYLTSNLATAANTETTLTGFTEVSDPSGSFNAATGIYTAPFTGWFTFRLFATNDPTATSGINSNVRKMKLRRVSDNFGVFTQFTTPNNPTATRNMQSVDVTLFMDVGDQLKMSVENQAAGTFLAGSDLTTGTGWLLVNTSDALAGQPIDIGANAPKIQQIDLLKDILKKYNLVMVPDRNIPKLIHFEPFGDYIGGGNTLDWTSKLDYSKDQVISPTTDYQAKVLTFTYSKGNDAASELFNKEGKRIYGDYLIEGYTTNPSDHPNDFAVGNKDVTLVAQSTPCNTINGTSNVVPKFVDASGEFVEPGLRYLYIDSNQCYIALYDEGITDGVLTSVNAANHYSSVNPTLSDDDLNFAPETPLHIITANPYNNLFNKYWRPYLNELYSPSARRLECYMYLTINDIVTFGFDDRIWIIDAWYRLLNISNYEVGMDEPVQCEFMRLLDAELDCESTPYQITIQGIVQFQLPDETLTFGTEDCCNRYGYNWDPELARCFAFGGNVGQPDRPNGVTTEVTGGNFGIAVDGASVRNAAMMANASNVSSDTQFSFVAGSDVTIENNNANLIAVGDHIIVDEGLRGVAAFGKNTKVFAGGLHLGGGWFNDDRNNADGQSQYGVIPYISEGNFTNSSTDIIMTIEGRSGLHLVVDEGAVLNCVMTISVMKWDPTGGIIDDTRTAQFAFTAYKVSGEAKKSTVHQVYDFGGLHPLDLHIDTTTDVTEHRFDVSMGGSGHPHNNIKIAASLTYTQIKE